MGTTANYLMMENESNINNLNYQKQFATLESRSPLQVGLEAAVMVFIIVMAICGNTLVLVFHYQNHSLRNITGIYIFSLAITDILMATFIMPLSVSILISSQQEFPSWLCVFQGFFILTLAWTSLHLMTLMALNRFFCVVKKTHYTALFTKRKSIIIIVVVVIVAAVFVFLPIVIGVSKVEFWPSRGSCFVTFTNTLPTVRRVCICMYLVVYTVIPMTIIGFCYFNVHKVVATHRNMIKIHPQSESTSSECTTLNVEEVKITKTIFAVVICFLLCWIPAVFVEIFNAALGARSLPRWAYMIYIYLGYISCATNPIIYSITNRKYRKMVKKLISFSCKAVVLSPKRNNCEKQDEELKITRVKSLRQQK